MLRDKMEEIVAREKEHGDRYWVNDRVAANIAIAAPGEDAAFLERCVGIHDEEYNAMIVYGPRHHMVDLAAKLNKLSNIEELMA